MNVSHKLAELCRSHLGGNDKIKVIGNGINPAEIYQGHSPLREKYAGSKIILSVGSLKKTKGHDLTLRAFKTVKSSSTRLSSDYRRGGEGKPAESGEELGIYQAVEFIAPQPHSRLWSICRI